MEEIDFIKLKEINNKKIEELQKKMSPEKNDEDLNIKMEIRKRIKDLLEKDEALFFNISYEEGITILAYILDSNEVQSVYEDLTSPQNFLKLKKEFKI